MYKNKIIDSSPVCIPVGYSDDIQCKLLVINCSNQNGKFMKKVSNRIKYLDHDAVIVFGKCVGDMRKSSLHIPTFNDDDYEKIFNKPYYCIDDCILNVTMRIIFFDSDVVMSEDFDSVDDRIRENEDEFIEWFDKAIDNDCDFTLIFSKSSPIDNIISGNSDISTNRIMSCLQKQKNKIIYVSSNGLGYYYARYKNGEDRIDFINCPPRTIDVNLKKNKDISIKKYCYSPGFVSLQFSHENFSHDFVPLHIFTISRNIHCSLVQVCEFIDMIDRFIDQSNLVDDMYLSKHYIDKYYDLLTVNLENVKKNKNKLIQKFTYNEKKPLLKQVLQRQFYKRVIPCIREVIDKSNVLTEKYIDFNERYEEINAY